MTHDEIDALDGEALAAAVAVRVMGWARSKKRSSGYPGQHVTHEIWKKDKYNAILIGLWHPDHNIAQAFEVAARVRELHPTWWAWAEEHGSPVLWRWGWQIQGGGSFFADAAILSTAICRAALKMMEV